MCKSPKKDEIPISSRKPIYNYTIPIPQSCRSMRSNTLTIFIFFKAASLKFWISNVFTGYINIYQLSHCKCDTHYD